MTYTLPFDILIKECLLNSGLVSGTVVVSRQGQVMFRHGDLFNISLTEIQQFLKLFGGISTEADLNHDFKLTYSDGQKIIYKTYQKTYSSVYATCSQGSGGLTVCNLPYGMLICVYRGATSVGKTVKTIEAFCDLVRR
ncbi:uncharacterized protein LOC127875299 isoform X2 [Dreissena polymorpha]|uniref:Profilin n=1 Tax=Dreissena polymorpha TaxID=45954 RepID=A0A9D4LAC2_DREPO|nr:uncharacterized protein LOC127875299 isoform X1 [Dreissena polymorpha]XP_052276232.1 uncharacterized protein LOC127875299 isoform X1 [Dreissena polymorpha]XP_052276233.1 uncharacterized protein LOC127875299 isoform X1 [Dreissena polymorpha]XP_052276234.1 uncharacterized protein LOC127875299 isoform X2 [Dreissena polymorpha]KAH3853452.1 hypothetical protein DPMN_095976 [Dreissena polymorpha]